MYAVLFLAAAVSTAAKEKMSPSSVAINAPVETVKAVLAAHLVGNGWRLDSDNQFQQVWAKSMEGMRGALISMIGTPSACYAIHPRHLLTFNFVPGEKGSTVVVETDQLETATALCQRTTQEIDGKKERAATATELADLKALCEKLAADKGATPAMQPAPVATPIPAPPTQPASNSNPALVPAPALQGATASDTQPESLGEIARRLRKEKAAQENAAQEKKPNQ